MLFGGLQKTTLVDYPGKVAATVFTIGCNFRCPYCHNPELVLPELIENQPKISENEVLAFLQEKQGLLEGVCITGGEPTIHSGLIGFIKKVKDLGYAVKLDTNGSNPKILKNLLDNKMVDYVAMDIKCPLDNKYQLFNLGRTPIKNIKNIKTSVSLLKNGKIDYEFRTTVAPMLSETDILEIADWLKPAKAYFLQRFESQKVLSKDCKNLNGLSEEKLQNIIKQIKPFFLKCDLR